MHERINEKVTERILKMSLGENSIHNYACIADWQVKTALGIKVWYKCTE